MRVLRLILIVLAAISLIFFLVYMPSIDQVLPLIIVFTGYEIALLLTGLCIVEDRLRISVLATCGGLPAILWGTYLLGVAQANTFASIIKFSIILLAAALIVYQILDLAARNGEYGFRRFRTNQPGS
jgi:hypothetical protein